MSQPRSPSGEGRGLPAPLIALVGVILAIRLIVGASLHLTEDEAYYRLWAMAPAFGYYDHPPMIAWWIWLGRHLAGDTPLGVRVMPSLASAVTSFLVFDLARLAGADRRTATRAGVWYNAMLLVAAGGFLAVPDAPATLFWTLSVWCAMRAVGGVEGFLLPSREKVSAKQTDEGARGDLRVAEPVKPDRLRGPSSDPLRAPPSPARGEGNLRLRWWLAAGVAAGLATLSKYSSLFLGPGVLIWLIATREGRAALKGPGPWLSAVIAGGLFGVNVAWNASHHWLTFTKQFGRVAPTHLAPQHLTELVATQILLINPLIALFAVAGFFARKKPGVKLAPFVATSAPFALYLVLHSLHDRVQPHWPAPIYPALAICAAVGARRLGETTVWARLRIAAPALGLAACAAALLCLAVPARLFPAGLDPVLPLRGWTVFAGRLERLRLTRGAGWVGTMSYGLAAQLADETALRAPVTQLTERDRYADLRLGPAPDMSRPGLVVDLPRRMSPVLLARCFAVVQPLGGLDRGGRDEAGKAYAVVLVGGRRPATTSCGPS